MQHTLLSCALLGAAFSSLPAQSVTLTSDEVLRIHFFIPSPPSPPPDVLEYGIGLVTVNSAYTTRTSRLWNCGTLLGTAVSSSFGTHVGALSLGVCNSWNQAGSVWNFDSPGVVASFASLQNASIQGIIDFELATGSITLDLSNVTMLLVRATSSSGGSVCSPGAVVTEAVVVPKLVGPAPGTAGTINTWSTTGSTPGNLMVYALGFDCAPILFPSAPPVMFDLAPPIVLFVDVVGATGASSLSLSVPASGSGATLMAQCGELIWPALRVSNFVTHTFP
ncbi:MAG TPA: hypothetical protein VFZ65_04525 [Planctomycetota bacterium]|nr:hypothetical protein [Planctomycetota bacterium]